MNKKIVIVEDQKIIAKVFSILLTKKGFEVFHYTTSKEAIANTLALNPVLVLMDVQLNEDVTGIDIAKTLRKNVFSNQIIFTTGNLLDTTIEQTKDISNCMVLIKPVDLSEIEKIMN